MKLGGSTTSSTTVPQYVTDYIQGTVLPTATSIGTGDFQGYTGNLTATTSPYTTQAGGLYGQAGSIAAMTPEDYAAQTQANMNPYQQNVIDATLAQSAADYADTSAGLLSNIAGSGAFGNDRRGVAEGQLAADYSLGNQSTIANLLQSGYQSAMDQTNTQVGNQLAAATGAASGLAGLGAQDVATQIANNQQLYDEFLREQQDPYDRLNALIGGAAAIPNVSSTTESSSPGLLDFLAVGASAVS